MVFVLICLVGCIASALLGFYLREVRNTLAFIGEKVAALKSVQDEKEKQAKKMTFADPVKWDELDDQERIDLLNT